MSRNRIELPADRETVFDILLDPYAFPKWVVGAKRIRGVDPEWPRIGSAFYHASGAGGELTVKDKTELVTMERPQSVVLQAFLRPLGIVRIRLYLDLGRRPDSTKLTMIEAPAPGTKLRPFSKLLDPALKMRNARSLRCLRKLVQDTVSGVTSESSSG
ncbi:MAG TPA: SRPBCC family protein [Actinomycetota bacterium]|nr:SRPBCC family protein [Actinomycetota bacterium]